MTPKYFLVFMLLVIICAQVVSAKIILQNPQSGGPLYIQYPKNSYYLFNSTNQFKFQVYNSTMANLSSTVTPCTLTIYNDTGSTLVNQLVTMDTVNTKDYTYTLGGNISNRAIIYTYKIYCVGVNQSGFVSFQFAISRGETMDDSNTYWPIGLLLTAVMFAMLYMGFTLKDDHYPLKMFLIWVGALTWIPITQIAANIGASSYIEPNIQTILNLMSYLSILVGIIVTALFMIYVLQSMLNILRDTGKRNNLRSR